MAIRPKPLVVPATQPGNFVFKCAEIGPHFFAGEHCVAANGVSALDDISAPQKAPSPGLSKAASQFHGGQKIRVHVVDSTKTPAADSGGDDVFSLATAFREYLWNGSVVINGTFVEREQALLAAEMIQRTALKSPMGCEDWVQLGEGKDVCRL